VRAVADLLTAALAKIERLRYKGALGPRGPRT
jgi:hypothetical protein